MKINEVPKWILGLDREDTDFLKEFILTSGSLKQIAKTYDVSYPTIRLKVDRLIQKIKMNDREEETFEAYIKKLALDSRLDLETANSIIEKYNEGKQQ